MTPKELDHIYQLEAELSRRYGALLNQADLAILLRYPSVQAIQKARARGDLGIPMIKIPPRRGWYATARAVAEFLAGIERFSSHSGAPRKDGRPES
jgi:hypothetical protein